ncbi:MULTISPECIES: hypothetical protein [Flavobacteriaceae]|uniref:hypothetical protein n=1 Tax=Flavobacteriaceae TaxID=49546 RepID=UPI001490BABF|nr:MULTISPECIES: hypothetical protein [Allomuricauda]MDC6365743.1 hypothetical protein [Muricauda sp. AC10]
MSKSIAKVYANTVKRNQRILYGVWEPGFPVQLGDYGVMKGNIFTQLGNISEFEELKNFGLKIRKDDTQDEKTFTSKKGVQFELGSKADATVNGIEGNASIEIKFSKENAVFFNGAECVFELIENKYQLGQELLKIHKKSKERWRKEFVVVTDRVLTKRALILVSTSSDFSIKLEADAEVPVIDLAEASLGLKISKQQSTGYKVITEEGITPLIGLSKIKKPFLFMDKEFKPMMRAYTVAMEEVIADYKYGNKINDEELHFAQLTDDLDDDFEI